VIFNTDCGSGGEGQMAERMTQKTMEHRKQVNKYQTETEIEFQKR
jgi:hypothetical protein